MRRSRCSPMRGSLSRRRPSPPEGMTVQAGPTSSKEYRVRVAEPDNGSTPRAGRSEPGSTARCETYKYPTSRVVVWSANGRK